MPATQILVFDPDLATSRIQSALVEAAWPLPLIHIADLEFQYGGETLDVARERARLSGVDTVILQVSEASARSPLLSAWLEKVLALSPSGRPVVPNLRAVVVAQNGPWSANASSSNTTISNLLERLRRAAESVGIVWLSPQIIDPAIGPRAVEAAVRLFTHQIQGRQSGSPVESAHVASPLVKSSLARHLGVFSARAALVCAGAHFVLTLGAIPDTKVFGAWEDLASGWLGVGLATLVATTALRPIPSPVRALAWLALTGFAFQVLAAAVPGEAGDVLRTIPQPLASGTVASLLVMLGFAVRD